MDIISKEIIALNGRDKINIYGVKVGQLKVKESVLNSKKSGLFSTLISFKDKTFSDWLPVWAWVIEHPEGIFLIDTGLTSDVNQTGYFKPIDFISRYYFEKQMIFKINREEEIDFQLKKIGIKNKAISKIILTHLHIDHVGGIKHFPNTPILVNKKEWETKDGSFPKLFPPNIKLQTIDLDSKSQLLDECHFLTKSKDLVVFPSPGHTRGHISIALIAKANKIYLLGGDVTYTAKRLTTKSFSATINNRKENIKSCDKILDLAKTQSVIYLPSHDLANAKRLEEDDIIISN